MFEILVGGATIIVVPFVVATWWYARGDHLLKRPKPEAEMPPRRRWSFPENWKLPALALLGAAAVISNWILLAAVFGLIGPSHAPIQTGIVKPAKPFSETYAFTAYDARQVRDEFFKIQNSMPPLLVLQTAYEFEARTVADGLFGGISRAGVNVSPPIITKALTPQEIGISIRVADLSKIPRSATAVGLAIENALGVEPKYTAMRELQDEQFTIFIGSNPNEH
jgi:hypothetical protein